MKTNIILSEKELDSLKETLTVLRKHTEILLSEASAEMWVDIDNKEKNKKKYFFL